MIFFGKSAKERELIKKYQMHYEQFIKNYEIYKTLQINVLKIEEKYKRQISIFKSKRKSLHEANYSILKAKNTINMIAYPKVLSKEEYDNFVLYNEYNERINMLKEKLQKGFEIIISYESKQSTTYMFMYQNESSVQGYKIYSQSDKLQIEKEIKMLQAKLEEFSLDQVNFFENKISWKNDIEKRLKRFVQFEEDHTNIKESLFQHIDNMRKTKKEIVESKDKMKTFYNANLKEDKALLNNLYSNFSSKTKKNLEKKQNSVKDEDFSM